MAEVGERYGRWMLDEEIPRVRGRGQQQKWWARCDCGKRCIVFLRNLMRGLSQSCGCFAHEQASKLNRTHGKHGTPEYVCWSKMKARCYNPKSPKYPSYGGRGITVCKRWLDDFAIFHADMGSRPSPKHSIERKNNNGNYEPGNCVWATAKQQARNRRSSALLTFRGQTRTIAEWAEITGISASAISLRIQRYGWAAERALST